MLVPSPRLTRVAVWLLIAIVAIMLAFSCLAKPAYGIADRPLSAIRGGSSVLHCCQRMRSSNLARACADLRSARARGFVRPCPAMSAQPGNRARQH